MEDQTTRRRCRVDVFRQGPEARTASLDDLDNVQQVAQGARQAVVLCDDDDIPLAELVEQTIKLRPLAQRATDLVGEDALRSRPLQRIELGIEVLVFGRYAGIAKDHAAL